jgi:hypothetical protein
LANVIADAGSSDSHHSSNSWVNRSRNSQESHLDLNGLSRQLIEMAAKVEESHRQAKAAHNLHSQALDRAACAWNAYAAATTGVHTSLIRFHDASTRQAYYQHQYNLLTETLAAHQASEI